MCVRFLSLEAVFQTHIWATDHEAEPLSDLGVEVTGLTGFLSLSAPAASVLQAMAVLVCAEMYQVKRLQHLCEVCVCAYLQSMPSRELASTGISVIRLLRRAKVRPGLDFVFLSCCFSA